MAVPSRIRVAARFASQRKYDSVIERLLGLAESGNRLKVGRKNIWMGQGNTSGMHSYAEKERLVVWAKSGRRFEKKLRAFPPGTVVGNFYYKNITRDRGRWVPAGTFTIPDPNETPKVDPNKVSIVKTGPDSFEVQFRKKTYRIGDKIKLKDDYLWKRWSEIEIIPRGATIKIVDLGYGDVGPSMRLLPSTGIALVPRWVETPSGGLAKDGTWKSKGYFDPSPLYTFAREGFPAFVAMFNGDNKFSSRDSWKNIPKRSEW